jgi:hypothetical protein
MWDVDVDVDVDAAAMPLAPPLALSWRSSGETCASTAGESDGEEAEGATRRDGESRIRAAAAAAAAVDDDDGDGDAGDGDDPNAAPAVDVAADADDDNGGEDGSATEAVGWNRDGDDDGDLESMRVRTGMGAEAIGAGRRRWGWASGSDDDMADAVDADDDDDGDDADEEEGGGANVEEEEEEAVAAEEAALAGLGVRGSCSAARAGRSSAAGRDGDVPRPLTFSQRPRGAGLARDWEGGKVCVCVYVGGEMRRAEQMRAADGKRERRLSECCQIACQSAVTMLSKNKLGDSSARRRRRRRPQSGRDNSSSPLGCCHVDRGRVGYRRHAVCSHGARSPLVTTGDGDGPRAPEGDRSFSARQSSSS